MSKSAITFSNVKGGAISIKLTPSKPPAKITPAYALAREVLTMLQNVNKVAQEKTNGR